VRFLIDNQLPVALVRFLEAQGAECRHVLEEGLGQSPDSEIWQYAADWGAALVSKDEDFFHLAGRHGAPVPLVWIRLGNCRTQALLGAIRKAWPRILACLEAGDRVVEVR
jgi:predicted nuclease of predicted toxin-antitoxin system